LLFVILCLSNTQSIAISLWPLAYELVVPLYLVVLTGVFLGFILSRILLMFEPKKQKVKTTSPQNAKKTDTTPERTDTHDLTALAP